MEKKWCSWREVSIILSIETESQEQSAAPGETAWNPCSAYKKERQRRITLALWGFALLLRQRWLRSRPGEAGAVNR